MAWTLADPTPHARARDPGRRVLHRPVPRLHVLPRRARAPQARAALPDALLPDDLARRRGRRGRSSASSRRWCCRRTSSSPPGSRCARCCCSGRSARDYAVYGVLGLAALFTTIGCAIWGVQRVLHERDQRIAQLLRRAARAGSRERRPASHRRSLVHGTILHGNQYMDRTLATQPTTYYTNTSGIGRLLDVLHPRIDPLRVGVIGLGTGSLAVYGTPGRHLQVLRDQSGRRRRREARLHLPARQRRDDRDRAGRRAAGAGARAAADVSTCW